MYSTTFGFLKGIFPLKIIPCAKMPQMKIYFQQFKGNMILINDICMYIYICVCVCV
jgi:hypothetical protein